MALNFKPEGSGTSDKDVKDLRKEGEGFMGEDLDQHESYGMISIGQTFYGKGANCFGSSIRHGSVITLTLTQAERSRDEYGDSYFQRAEVAKVRMSAAQFTGMLTKMNTMGVPCTIERRWVGGKYTVMEDPPNHNVKAEMYDDIKASYAKLEKRVKDLEADIQERLKGNVKKADKEQILHDVLKISQAVGSNLSFLQKQQIKKLEKAGGEIMAEADAMVSGMLKVAGLDALKKQIENNSFDAVDTGDVKEIGYDQEGS